MELQGVQVSAARADVPAEQIAGLPFFSPLPRVDLIDQPPRSKATATGTNEQPVIIQGVSDSLINVPNFSNG